MTTLGVYFAPQHGIPEDRAYIAALQPPVIRLLDPDVSQVADMHRLVPGAIIAPRTWAFDDNNGQAVRELMADPVGAGRRLAEQYAQQWARWTVEASARGLVLPSIERVIFNASNEPNQGGTPEKIAENNVAFLNRCTELGIRATALCLGVGWPDNTGPDTPVNWQPYTDAGLPQAIKRGGHWLELHEYAYKTGPQDGWRWWCGRHLQCPYDVPILLGEIGIDNYVDAVRWQKEGGARGWQGNVSPDQYAEMIQWHIRNSDTRLVGALPFILDYRSNSWESFNIRAAIPALLARKDAMVPQTAYVSPVGTTPPEQPTTGVPALIHPIADPALRRITQRWGENPEYYAQYNVKGHNGIDYGVPMATPIRAVADGQAVEVLNDSAYGLYIKLIHAWGETLYAHLSFQAVRQGEKVNAGQVIGLSGNSGNSTGPHLHFAMRVHPYSRGDGFNGFTDPLPYLTDVSLPTPVTENVNDLLARLITAEAGGEPVLGQLAVAHVVKNRVERGGWWGDSWIEVINYPYQFAKPAATATPVARAVADLVLQGATVDPTDSSTHFHNLSVHPAWADNLQKTRQIGNHIFYKG